MKKIKIISLISFLSIILISCGTVKEGFKNQKKNNTDEFLVEKKAPLVMPPNYNELPVPKDKDAIENEETNEVKKLITKSNKSSSNKSSNNSNESLENKILGKIKNN
tara:strand:+ start:1153 stop:1473 length:321 start_codon:yes stop_codon:yes gene_type:complete